MQTMRAFAEQVGFPPKETAMPKAAAARGRHTGRIAALAHYLLTAHE
jgi:hypothetical protein